MKSAHIATTIALATHLASCVDVPCYVIEVATEKGPEKIRLGDLSVYQGAVLTIKSVTTGDLPSTFIPVDTIESASGSVDLVDGKVKVKSNESGTIVATVEGCSSITINDVGHMWEHFLYKSSDLVDFFQTATTMTGGNPSTGEYFTDDSTNPIHLYADAKETNSVEQNWYVVSDEPSPPALNLVSGVPTKNDGYVPYAVGAGSLIAEEVFVLLKDQYGSAIDFPFWYPAATDSQEPKIVGTSAHPNGMVTAATWNSATGEFDLVSQGAHIPAFVLATKDFVPATTTPVPSGGTTTTSTAVPTSAPPTAPPTDHSILPPGATDLTTTTNPAGLTNPTGLTQMTNTNTNSDEASTSSAVSRAVVTGLFAFLGLLLF